MNDEQKFTIARLIRETNAALNAEPLPGLRALVEQHAREAAERRAAWWAGLSRWERAKHRARNAALEIRYRIGHAWDALCGRECCE